ncbi:MAG TPA: CHAT domain-containing protein [Thermoanaerobaculia bacterium]|jgi:CHAT domain-containing protein|nr:CHAT domain-containing protein [Thermoanaerobaculia bacterium]
MITLHKAVKAAADAITEYQSAGVVSNRITVLLLQAKAEAEWRAAIAEAEKSLQAGQRFKPGLHLVFEETFEGMRKSTAPLLEEAIRLHGIWRGTAATDVDRTRREQEITEAYDFLITLRARQKGQAANALRLAEEARSRVLLDLLATVPNPGEMAPAADLEAERRHLETGISQIEEELRRSPTSDQQQKLRDQHMQLELKWNAVGKKSLPQEPPLDTAAMETLARETGPLLVYYVSASEVWGFLIRPDTAEIYLQMIAVSRDELAEKINALRYSLANSLEQDALTQAFHLGNLLIAPFSDHLPASGPLVIVPHGPLHGLPFESLRDAVGKRLFERWQISIAPSVSALDLARHRHAALLPSDSFLGFAAGRGLDLPAEEVAKIAVLFGTDKSAFQSTLANYKNYKEQVGQTRHLFFATRGVHSEGSRTETYLEIEATPNHDDRLTAAEIATIPLHAELATLAACDTSYGHALLSDERLDLTRSFLIAGAAAVLAARWKVPEDSATSQFLVDFYRAYRQGGPQGTGLRKDEALTEARRLSRKRGDPAQVWASWVLIGDAR